MDKIELYEKAKAAYYSGEPIMGDAEFDALEAELGLENEGYIGDVNSNYTVLHPCIMGSLSKIQVKESKIGVTPWDDFHNQLMSYLNKAELTSNPYCTHYCVVTPKYDGCSFEVVVKNGTIVSISSRGDGDKGKDLYNHLYNKVKPNCVLKSYYNSMAYEKTEFSNYILRGEVLIKKSVFEEKYANKFANTRSFVAGLLNRDYDKNDYEMLEQLNDLDIVIYDVKIIEQNARGNFIRDYDWFKTPFNSSNIIEDLIDVPKKFEVLPYNQIDLASIYNRFAQYRDECEYSLDGFVFKPLAIIRAVQGKKQRPIDCVAVKFKPQMQETVIVDVIWKLGKTGEYNPVIITDPIQMDGKTINKASAFNYGYMIEKNISIGTKVVLSLAGDIIPYIYEVTDTSRFSESRMNLNTINKYYIDGVHLMADLDSEETRANKLLNSIKSLGIKGLGESVALKVVEYIKEQCKGDDFFDIEAKELPDNVLYITPEQMQDAIGGKTGTSIMKVYREFLKSITLKDVIRCCNFKMCGERTAEEIAKMLVGNQYDMSGKAKESYEWAFDKESTEYKMLTDILNAIGYSIESFKEVALSKPKIDPNTQIPVILTGEPNDYKSKSEFIDLNPQYRETTSWKEVKILFTNSLESNTNKMKKAREKGIEIKIY